ncbi:MAG: pro-sigmaK processing inhibitor BofA family protein [Eubacteriales bacterium]|nr:pro-sigmaK processing inhibitor BofA family protein [Eubacteriales bacterium]MCI7570863.1 pro-sigmaK processing inhibitor BofA family protein [Clostridiales bacterium]MDD7550408.1 pro-sigmaK processing inhibitor BofA family protein [Clostridia bacterium]MDY5754570.1 pro-sigmaK processing inhibitor BofA family protein [Eubacteriales bacterium]
MLTAIITIAIVLLAIFLLFKIFGWSLKMFFKLLVNTIIGGVILILLNLVGGLIGFTVPITILSSLIVGVLGVAGVILVVLYTLLV